MVDETLKSFYDFVTLFYELSPLDSNRLLQNVKYLKVPSGEVLLEKGEIVKGFYFIREGILKISGKNEKGEEGVLYFISKHQFGTTPRSYYLNSPSAETLIAACDSEVVFFPKKTLDSMGVGMPCFKEIMHGVLQQGTIFRVDERKELFKERDISAGFKKFIIRYPEIAFKVSTSDMASFLCMSELAYTRMKYLLV